MLHDNNSSINAILEQLIISSQLIISVAAGVLGSIVKLLCDIDPLFNLRVYISNVIVGGTCGLLSYLIMFDYSTFTPHQKIGLALISGFCGYRIFVVLSDTLLHIVEKIATNLKNRMGE